MAKYRITAPDGGTYEVTAPDDATQEQVLAYAQANYQESAQQPKADFSGVQGGVRSTDEGRYADGWKGGIARDVAGGVRSAIQGVGGLVGALGGDAFNHYLVPGEQPSYRDAAAGLADRMGLPKPLNAQERVLGDVGEALTGTALTMGAGGALAGGSRLAAPTAAQRAGDFLTAQPKLQVLSTATGAGAAGVTRESGGGQGAQLLAGVAGGLGPGLAGAATGATVRGAVRGKSGARMRQTIDDFASVGADPSVGQASGRGWVQGLEGLLSKGPTSGGVMGRFAQNQSDDIGRGLQAKAEQLSPGAGSENAGLAIERGMKSFKGDTGTVKKALYWAVDQHIPGNSPTPMANTRNTLARLTTPDPTAPATTGAMIQPRIAQLRQNLEADLQAGGGSLTYEALKRIRSDIGEAINGSSPLNPSSDLRELNALYGSLSEDMLAAAKQRGPAAVAAAQRANKYTRDVANRMELVQRVLDKNGGPEKVFQAAMAGTNDGATKLRAVMYSLPKEEQQAVTAAVVKRMGLPSPGQAGLDDTFSASTFLTSWNKLSPESRQVLFGRYGKTFKASMDRIASVADNIKSGSKVYANPSGSADKGVAIGYWTGLLAALGTGHITGAAGALAAGASANIAARVLTSPKAVNWLALATTMPYGAFISSLRQMGETANRSGDTEMQELHGLLQQAVDQQSNGGQEQQWQTNEGGRNP